MNETVYSNICIELSRIHTEISSIKLRNPRAPLEMDAILRVALAMPNLRYSQISDRCSDELGWRVSLWPGKVLQMCGIEDAPERRLLSDYLVGFNRALGALIHAKGSEEFTTSLATLSEIIDDRRLYSLVPGLARSALMMQRDALCSSTDAMERDLGLRLRDLLRVMLISQTTPVFRRILHVLASTRDQGSAPSISDRLSGMIRDAAMVSAQTNSNESSNDVVDAETLAEQNADLRAALFGLQHELESLQEQIRAIQSTSAADATARFLTELNTGGAGHLLDNIVFSSRAIRELEASGWIPEPIEVEGIVATITMLSDHLAHLGVQPIYEVGELAQIAMEDLSEIQYVGSEFGSSGDLKTVRFKSPGWRYHEQRIARAQAVEIPSDSSASPA